MSVRHRAHFQGNKHLSIRDMAVFGMLGALMFVTKVIMEAIPNIHLLGLFIMVFTLTYHVRALIPIYIYVLLNGIIAGFSFWWIPYLYIWTILWGVTMLLPRKMPVWLCSIVYPLVCTLHGLTFGILYAPVQALMFGYTLEETMIWIAGGLTFDVLHAIGNFAAGLFILPLHRVLEKLEKRRK
ncbi:MAG: hypothetical protein J6R89_04915 [Clostridia bacterium]|nr:hypothetical protein [Clostridia bacterium]